MELPNTLASTPWPEADVELTCIKSYIALAISITVIATASWGAYAINLSANKGALFGLITATPFFLASFAIHYTLYCDDRNNGFRLQNWIGAATSVCFAILLINRSTILAKINLIQDPLLLSTYTKCCLWRSPPCAVIGLVSAFAVLKFLDDYHISHCQCPQHCHEQTAL